MKDTPILIIFLFVLLSIASCGQKEHTDLIQGLIQAEKIMYEYPDSALRILQAIKSHSTSDKFQDATWALLMTQARYKCYQPQSDSLINIAYAYFMCRDNVQRKAMALYYKGALYEEKNNIEEAQEFYLKAISAVEKAQDYQLAHLIYNGLGDIYIFRSFNEYALEDFEKALHYARLAKNNTYICSSYITLARATSVLSQFDSSINYYQEAIKMAKEHQDYRNLSSAMSELGGIYTHTGDYHSSLAYTKEALQIKKDHDIKPIETTYLTLGDNYRHLNLPDSAYYYLHKALRSSSIYTIRSAYQSLYYLSRDTREYEKMCDYSDNLWIYQDSIQKLKKSKALIEMQERYNQQKIIIAKDQLKIEKDQVIRSISTALIVLLCGTVILFFIYQRKLLQKERTIQLDKEKIKQNILQLHENEIIISRKQNQIAELHEQITYEKEAHEQSEEQRTAIATLQQQTELLLAENLRLQQHINKFQTLPQKQEIEIWKANSERVLQLEKRERQLTEALANNNELMRRLRENPKFLQEPEWKKLRLVTDKVYNHFTERLIRQFPQLTEVDMQLCILVKLRFTVSQIAILTAVAPTTVSVQKQRLKKRILQENELCLKEGQTLDMWIWEY